MQAFRYWWCVISIAFFKAGELLGWGHPLRWPISAGLTVVGAVIFYWAIGDTKVIADKMIWLVCGLAGAGAVFLVVFFFAILATPPRLAAEATAEYHRTVSGLERRVVELSEVADGRSKSASRRTKINGFIGEANEIQSTIAKASRDQDFFSIKSHIDEWEKRARGFVAEEFPEFVELFSSDAGLDNGSVYKGSPVASSLRKRLERRVVRLGQLAADMPKS